MAVAEPLAGSIFEVVFLNFPGRADLLSVGVVWTEPNGNRCPPLGRGFQGSQHKSEMKMQDSKSCSLNPESMAASAALELPIGQALRFLRNRLKLRQVEAGRLGGPDFRTISHWETGRKQPSLRLLLRYLDALDADLCDLQEALDHVAGQPPVETPQRLIRLERRVAALEGWRLSQTAAKIEKLNERKAASQPAQETAIDTTDH